MIYDFKSLVLVRKGRAFYTTLYQEVFFGNPGGGGSLIKFVGIFVLLEVFGSQHVFEEKISQRFLNDPPHTGILVR